MRIEDFLERFVEGYLFGDLRAMSNVPAPAPGAYGACGYSMVLVTLAGSELLGSLVYSEPFNKRDGDKYLEHFWQEYLYPDDSRRKALSTTLRALVRNGLAHAFLTKPSIVVSTQREGTKNHLAKDGSGTLYFDAITLADDFRRAYSARVAPRLAVPEQRDALQAQLELIHREYSNDAARHAIIIGDAPNVDLNEAYPFIPSGQAVPTDASPINDSAQWTKANSPSFNSHFSSRRQKSKVP